GLRPLDLAPRARRHDPVDRRVGGVGLVHRGVAAQDIGVDAGGDRQCGPQVREHPPREELPERRPEREAEPRRHHDGAADRIARLRFQITQCHEPAEGDAEQHLRSFGAEPHHPAECLEVAEQLAEARKTARASTRAARRRISSRSPGNTRFTARVVVCTRAASHTVPTGFSGVPPPGPAIPVTAIVQSTENRRWVPSAIARTVSSETAPWASSVSSGTLSAAVLITSAYATTPPMKVSEAPGIAVIRSAIMPPVHDSA